MGLTLTMKPGELFTIGTDTVIQFQSRKGNQIRINIKSPVEKKINRYKPLKEKEDDGSDASSKDGVHKKKLSRSPKLQT